MPQSDAESREKKRIKTNNWRRNNPERWRAIHKRSSLKVRYGITLEKWHSIFDAQGRKCASCGRGDPGHKMGWAVDHCHSTMKVRSILCNNCNSALGLLREDPDVIEALARYARGISDAEMQEIVGS